MISCGMVREGPSGKIFAQSKDDLREECHMANSLGGSQRGSAALQVRVRLVGEGRQWGGEAL